MIIKMTKLFTILEALRFRALDLIRCALLAVALILSVKFGRAEFVKLSCLASPGFEFSTAWFHWIAIGLILLLAIAARPLFRMLQLLLRWIGLKWPFLMLVTAILLFLLIGGDGHPIHASWITGAALFVLFSILVWTPKIKDDTPEDALNRQYFVDRIAEIFVGRSPKTRRVAILGDWGSGKSLTLKLLKKRLLEEKETPFRIAVVNPWRCKTQEDAWITLARGVDEALGTLTPISRSWSKHPFVRVLAEMIPGKGVGAEVVRYFSGQFAVTAEMLNEKIKMALFPSNARLVLLVDDMERVDPKILRALFPVIDQLGLLENCYFVFAIDPMRVAVAFDEPLPSSPTTKGYLDKVFDLQVVLPDPRQKDVAAMVENLVNTLETPKLALAFASLRDLIPENPRLALHFYEDAKTKELLFLNRYGEKEKNFAAFFLITLFEIEFRGVSGFLLEKDIKNLLQMSGYLGALGAGQSERRDSGQLTKRMASKFGIVEGSIEYRRLDMFASKMEISAKPSDIEWAINDYSRLLELSHSERDVLSDKWETHAGGASIETMLAKCFDSKKHCEKFRCAEQLLEFEIDKISEESSELVRAIRSAQSLDGSLLRKVMARMENLRAHLRFAESNDLDFDLSLFGEDLFLKWLKFIDEVSLDGFDADEFAALQQARFSFHYDIAKSLSPFVCRNLSHHKIDQAVNRYPHDGSRRASKDHCEKLKKQLFRQVTDAVSDAFRDGTIMNKWPADFPEFDWNQENLTYPQNWVADDVKADVLAALYNEARTNSSISDSCAFLAESSYMHPMACTVGDHGHQRERIRVSELAVEDPYYLAFYWNTAMLADPSNINRQQLLRNREQAARQNLEKNYMESELFEKLFPLPADFIRSQEDL